MDLCEDISSPCLKLRVMHLSRDIDLFDQRAILQVEYSSRWTSRRPADPKLGPHEHVRSTAMPTRGRSRLLRGLSSATEHGLRAMLQTQAFLLPCADLNPPQLPPRSGRP